MNYNKPAIAAGKTAQRAQLRTVVVDVTTDDPIASVPTAEGQLLVYWVQGSGANKIMILRCAVSINGELEWKSVDLRLGSFNRYTNGPIEAYVD